MRGPEAADAASRDASRRLTFGVAVALMVQFAGVFIWAGSISARLQALERAASTHSTDHVLLARVETRVESIAAQLDRIEAQLEDQP
ncbi:MAG: hypothetical protein AAF753_05790 [Pseudomonadota bacterium]